MRVKAGSKVWVTVDDSWLLGEIVGAVDEADHFNQLDDFVEVADLLFQTRAHGQGYGFGGLVPGRARKDGSRRLFVKTV